MLEMLTTFTELWGKSLQRSKMPRFPLRFADSMFVHRGDE
jgi:hypothetical protein